MKHQMRKINRAVTGKDEISQIIEKCNVCRIGLFDGEYPYIVPMNFGFSDEDGLIFYFHCASEGRKLDILRSNPKVCFELDCAHQLIVGEKPCDYTMHYESIMGEGEISVVADKSERILGMNLIMQHYGKVDELHYNEEIFCRTAILKLTASSVIGKRLDE